MARRDIIKQKKARPKFDREELVQLIVCDILNGMSRYRVLLKLKRDQYEDFKSSEFSRSKQYDLVQEAYECCKIPLAEDRQKQRELFIARYEDILEECRDSRDRQNAIAALKEMSRLLGLYEPDKVDVNANVNVDISFGLEDDNETELQD
jgi:hypothetical protein